MFSCNITVREEDQLPDGGIPCGGPVEEEYQEWGGAQTAE